MPILPQPSLQSFFATSKFRKKSICFPKIAIFSKSTGQVGPYGSAAGIASSTFSHIYLNAEPPVNRQPGFRRELVEQIISFIIKSRNFLHEDLLKCKFPNPRVFIPNFCENLKISSFLQHFAERQRSSKQRFNRARKLILIQNQTSISY